MGALQGVSAMQAHAAGVGDWEPPGATSASLRWAAGGWALGAEAAWPPPPGYRPGSPLRSCELAAVWGIWCLLTRGETEASVAICPAHRSRRKLQP